MTSKLLEPAEGLMFTSDGKSITCKKCNLTSYHPCDVKYRYCGNCHMYLDPIGAGFPNREEFHEIYTYHKRVEFWDRVKRILFFWRKSHG